MKTSAKASRATLVQPQLVLLVAAVFLVAMVSQSFGATTVSLHTPHVGASSMTFSNQSDNGGLSSPVVWHFVLNQLDRGTAAGQLTATFASGGTKTATGRPTGNGQLQHFYVGTSGHDTLLSASALVASSGGKLVLSHVSYRVVPENPPVDPEDPPVDPEDPPVDPEDPPVDPEDPPVDPEDPPVDPEDPPVDPDDPDDPFLPFTEDDDPEVAAAGAQEEFLPFTGGTGALLSLAAALASAGGYGLRRWAMNR
ncbi:MAG: hypothetical protein U1E29_16090 [Coriobacteriia bacterium]|nr:hypothetical protein [Coriobacteriia bacterium]